VIRGGALRGSGYVAGVALGALTSVFLLRHLGVVDFGRYATVAALLGIVSGVTDAGLTAVGARELSLRPPGEERARLLRTLVALRLVLTPLGVLGAVVFAVVAGYDSTLVWGTVLAGIGVVLVNTQATMMMPLSIELRLGAVTSVEVAKQALTLAGVALLVLAGASLLPFFAVQIAVGVVVLAATPWVLGAGPSLRPALDREVAGPLVREALPMAIALAMNVVYFRVLVILTSLLASDVETGLFGTSFRVFEVLWGLPLIVLSVALPVLSVAGESDDERLRYGLQRLTEVAALVSIGLVLVLVAIAEPALVLLGGEEYRDAAPVLQIQALALVPVFVAQAWQLGLVSVRRQAALAVANAIALVVVVVLGVVLIESDGARGAAVAAVIAESVLAAAVLVALARSRRAVLPRFGFAPRLAVAAALGAAVLLLPVPDLVRAAFALGVFGAAATVLRLVPPELLHAFRRA
jgi:O-antigen/teichoic acid export membrane protein